MKKIFIMMALFFACIFASAQKNELIARLSKNQLPRNTVEFLNAHYATHKFALCFVEYDFGKIDDYVVFLTSGTDLKFDRNGELQSIDCGEKDSVPMTVLPQKIRQYLAINFNELKVVDYVVDDRGRRFEEHEIELINGVELTFNRKFKCVEIEY